MAAALLGIVTIVILIKRLRVHPFLALETITGVVGLGGVMVLGAFV